MRDYGLTAEQAERIHLEAASGTIWEDALTRLAESLVIDARAADARGARGDAATPWRQAATALNFAQMATNFDAPGRVDLFRQSIALFAEFARRADPAGRPVRLTYRAGAIFGWDFMPLGVDRAPAVIVIGGLSGWAISFYSMARDLNRRGLRCLLIDGPGQGQSRIDGGLLAHDGIQGGLSVVLDHARATGSTQVGVWGNSMGGLFAAAFARDDVRVAACCVNGAPPQIVFPEFRTAREQLAALFGIAADGDHDQRPDVRQALDALAYDGTKKPMRSPVIVCQGGADPLVPLDLQTAFLRGNTDPRSRIETWPDGEHTIYNHADERNARVTAWFADCLSHAN